MIRPRNPAEDGVSRAGDKPSSLRQSQYSGNYDTLLDPDEPNHDHRDHG